MQTWIAETIEPPMRLVHPACGLAYKVSLEMSSIAVPMDHVLAGMVKQLSSSNNVARTSHSTEGKFYQKAGIPTIICGPESFVQSHQPDKWIAESELDVCDRFIRQLADRLLV